MKRFLLSLVFLIFGIAQANAITLLTSGTPGTVDVQFSGSATGSITITRNVTYNPTVAGDYFNILSTTPNTGRFSDISLPTLNSGLSWDLSKLYSAGQLVVTSAPAGIPVSPVLWLDAGDIGSISTANAASANAVSAWMDKSGNNYNASQNTLAYQPSYNTTILNGYPSLTFNGSTQFISYPNVGIYTSIGAFIVFKATAMTDASGANPLLAANSWLSGYVHLNLSTAGVFNYTNRARINGDDANTAAGFIKNNISYISYVGDDGNKSWTYANGVNGVIFPNGGVNNKQFGPGSIAAWVNGGSPARHLNGNISEIIIYNTALSTPNRQAVENYLSNKWAIPITTNIDIRSVAADGYDWVTLNGTYGIPTGSLVIATPNAITLAAGNSFTVLRGANINSGRFVNITLPTLNAGLAWDLSNLYSAGQIVVTSAPGAIDVSPVLWLDASDIGSISTANGGTSTSVSRWTDKSGSNYSAYQTNTSYQPTYSVNVLNGKPVIRFDGTDDRMSTSLSLSAPYSVYIIFNYQSSTSAYRRAIEGSNNWLIGPYSNFVSHYAGGWVANTLAITQYQFYLANAINNASRSWFFVNGVNHTDVSGYVTAPGTIGLGTQGLAVNEPLNGDIAEVVIYNSALSTPNRLAVENYLANKWAIPVTAQIDLRSAATDGYDWVTLNGTYGKPTGNIDVTLIGGYVPTAGTTFTILRGPNIATGAINTITVPSLPNAEWDFNDIYTTGVIRVSGNINVGLSGGWTGASATKNISEPTNWYNGAAPNAASDVVIAWSSDAINWDSQAPPAVNSIYMIRPFTGTLNIVNNVSVATGVRVETSTLVITANTTLAIAGNYAQLSTATLNILLGTGTACGQFSVAGIATLNGTLKITKTLGNEPVSGNAYTLFSLTNRIGNFANIILPTLNAGLAWDLSQLYSQGQIVVTAAPGAIDVSPVLWLDASDIGSVCTANGGTSTSVSAWFDKSGNNNHPLQLSASQQPSYNQSVFNNLASIYFNSSTGQYLQTASNFGISGNPDMTVAYVVQVVNPSASQRFIGFGSTSSGAGFTLGRGTTTSNAGVSFWNYAQYFSDTNTLFASRIFTRFGGSNGSTTGNVYYCNGTSQPISYNAGGSVSIANSKLRIGTDWGAGYWNGYLSEIMYFNSALSTSNILIINNYFANKWAILITTNIDLRSASDYDSVTFNGQYGYATGNLVISPTLNFVPKPGNIFKVLNGNLTGRFSSITLPSIVNGIYVNWVTSNLYIDGTISVKSGNLHGNYKVSGNFNLRTVENTPILQLVPGATAAYSLRKLSPTYNGYCIQIQRWSDSATKDIGFIGNELDTPNILSFAGVSTASVSIGYDQSGNGNNAIQPTLVYQPIIATAGVICSINGMIGIKFINTNYDYLTVTPSSIFNDMTQFSIFCYHYYDYRADQFTQLVLSKHMNGTDGSFFAGYFGGNIQLTTINGSGIRVNANQGFITSQKVKASFVYNGAKNFVYTNNTLFTSLDQTGTINNTNYDAQIGSYYGKSLDQTYFFGGYINTIIFYKNKAFTANEINLLNININ